MKLKISPQKKFDPSFCSNVLSHSKFVLLTFLRFCQIERYGSQIGWLCKELSMLPYFCDSEGISMLPYFCDLEGNKLVGLGLL
jgi:hypothetical protein